MQTILSIILGNVFMNKIKLQMGGVKRTTFFGLLLDFYSQYKNSFTIYNDNPFIKVILVMVPIFDIIAIIPPYTIGWTIVIAIYNFIFFRIVTNSK